jgi:putative transposase
LADPQKTKALKAQFTSSGSSVTIGVMPQSLSKVILHIIFSTKDRQPWLDSNVRPRMHAYLATVCRDLGAELVHVGGVADHVHIVTTLPRTLSRAQLIEEIKKASSKWIKALDPRYRGFFWQRGYGAFSVSPSHSRPCCNTSTANENIIGHAPFGRNTANCCAGMGLISTSAIFGIKNHPCVETRFQR